MSASKSKLLNRMTSFYEDKFIENHFYEANLKFRWISTTFASLTLLYSLINLTLVLVNSNLDSNMPEISTGLYDVNTYILCGVSLFSYFFNLYVKQYKLYYISIYIQYLLFSLNHFNLGNLTRLLYQFGYINKTKNSNILSIIDFIFLFIDCIVKVLWTLSPLNNFLYLLISNICILIIIFGMSYQSSIFLLDFGIIFYAYYAINFVLISLLSKEILTLKKKNFLYENNFLEGNKNTFIDTINSGYIRIEEDKVRDKNNFFNKEAEILKTLLTSENFHASNNEEVYQNNESYRNSEKCICDEDIYEIIKKLILNISDNEEIARYKKITIEKKVIVSEGSVNFMTVNDRNFNSEIEKKNLIDHNFRKSENNLKSINIPQEIPNQVDLEVSTGQFINTNSNCIKTPHQFNNLNLISNPIEKIESYPDILKYLVLNKSKYKSFTYLGKSTILKGLDKTLSLKIYVRVSEEKNLEFILNDISKEEIYNGAMQFVIKTGQYLHDFKNPLICIHTEINEIKEDTELILGLICKHNEFIEVTSAKNLHSAHSGFTQRHNSPKFRAAEKLGKIDFDYEECLVMLDKFEYIKQMSEYCQGMIGSFEDFSKGIFKPNSMTIKIKNFDLLELLEFIDNMMNLKLSHSNKNLKFYLKTENIPELEEAIQYEDKQKLMIRSDEGKIKRVLINILSNSEKFTVVGSITLTVSQENINNKKYYKFSIQDTGRGMDSESLQKLFTPFFSENNNEHNKNGVGLGLLIVKEITEKIGLGLKITSEKGKGTNTTFYVEDHFISNYEAVNQFINDPNRNKLKTKQTNVTNTKQFSNYSSSNTHIQNNSIRSANSQYNIHLNLDTTEEVVRSQFHKMEKVEKLRDILKNLEESNNVFNDTKSEKNQRRKISIFDSLQKFIRKKSKKLNTAKAFKRRAKLSKNEFYFKYNTKQSVPINECDSVGIYSSHDNNSIKKVNRSKNVFNSIISNSSLIYQNISNNPSTTFQNLSVVKNEIEIIITPPINSSSEAKKHNSDNKLSVSDDGSKNIFEVSRRRSFQFKSNSDKELTYKRPDPPGEKTKSQFCLKPDTTINPSTSSFNQGNTSNINVTGLSLSTNSLTRSKFFFSDHKVSESNTISKSETNEILLDNYSRNVSILIIDDETSMRNFCINILKKVSESEKLQIIVEEADDGFTGLAKIFNKYFKNKETYDIIITDDNMTFLDGSNMFNVLSYIEENDLSKLRIEDKILNKVVICSADTEYVRSKIIECNSVRNLRLTEKPLSLDFIKSII